MSTAGTCRRRKCTVHSELTRRGGCRAGLRGLRVEVTQHSGVYRVAYSQWGLGDDEHDLRLTCIPDDLWTDGDASECPTLGVRTLSELFANPVRHPKGTLANINSRRCTLLDDWPYICCQPEKPQRAGISVRRRFKLMSRDGFRCRLCGRGADETTLEIDHYIPVAAGGADTDDNLWTLCFDCNRGKATDQLDNNHG